MTETGGKFKTGLCGCCSEPKTACLSWCIPCYVHGMTENFLYFVILFFILLTFQLSGKNAESVNLPIPLLGEGKGFIVHLLTYFVPCLDIYQIAKSREMVRNQNDIQVNHEI